MGRSSPPSNRASAIGLPSAIAQKTVPRPISSYVSRVLRLTLLGPEIVEAILEGRQPEGVRLPVLMRSFPGEWAKQRAGHAASLIR